MCLRLVVLLVVALRSQALVALSECIPCMMRTMNDSSAASETGNYAGECLHHKKCIFEPLNTKQKQSALLLRTRALTAGNDALIVHNQFGNTRHEGQLLLCSHADGMTVDTHSECCI